MTPGIYTDLTNMAYHAETGWVGSSALKRLIPEQYGPEPKNKKALWFGSAFHTTVLGGPSEPWAVHDYLTWDSKAAKEAAEQAEQDGHVPVLARDVEQINAMADSLKSHPEASDLIYGTGGQSEVSVFAEVDSVPSKARFDRLAGTTVVDVKTTSAIPSPYELTRAVVSFGYDLSADHYLRVAAAAGIPVERFTLVFVGKEPPHYVTVCDLDESFLLRGEALRDLALQRFCHPDFTDAYPGASGRLNLTLPRWAEL
jgi:hypothetical protein